MREVLVGPPAGGEYPLRVTGPTFRGATILEQWAAIDPSVATGMRRLHLSVETESALTRGMVVMDLLGLTDAEPNATVVTTADTGRFIDMLRSAIT